MGESHNQSNNFLIFQTIQKKKMAREAKRAQARAREANAAAAAALASGNSNTELLTSSKVKVGSASIHLQRGAKRLLLCLVREVTSWQLGFALTALG